MIIFLTVFFLSIKFINSPIQKFSITNPKFRPDTMKNDIHLAPSRPSLAFSDLLARFDVNYTRSIARNRARVPPPTINRVEGPRLIHFAPAIERNTRCNYRKLSRSTAWTLRRRDPFLLNAYAILSGSSN